MAIVTTIPKQITKGEELVIISRGEYEKFLKLRQQIEWEEKDTDEALRVFKEDKKAKKLVKIKSLTDLD